MTAIPITNVAILASQIQQRFSVSSDPAKVAFGGGSFSGVSALYAAMHYPHVFGCVLAESPSLWIAEGRFLQVCPRVWLMSLCSPWFGVALSFVWLTGQGTGVEEPQGGGIR